MMLPLLYGGIISLVLGSLAILICKTNIIVCRFHPNEPADYFVSTKRPVELLPRPEKLLIMSWNIKFAGGRLNFFFDLHGDRVRMKREEVIRHLEGIAQKINQVNPDILLLQEVDIESDRVAGINMMEWLLEHTHFSYGAYASQWKAWIPVKKLGFVNSGNAILSRWPLKECERHALSLRTDQNPIEHFFYLRRNALCAHLSFPDGQRLTVLNTHLEAYCQDDTRTRQIEDLFACARKAEELGYPLVLGGDFNLIPPGARRFQSFPDCKAEDLGGDFSTVRDALLPLYEKLHAAIPLPEYLAHEERYFSHSILEGEHWNRLVDHLFTNQEWKPQSALVHQDKEHGGMETMPLSDHAPLTAVLLLPENH